MDFVWVVKNKNVKFSLCNFFCLLELQILIWKCVLIALCAHVSPFNALILYFPASAVFGTFQQNQVHTPSTDCTDHLYQEGGSTIQTHNQ